MCHLPMKPVRYPSAWSTRAKVCSSWLRALRSVLSRMPWWRVYSPVTMLARLGEHSGVTANMFRNCAPSRASRSMLGVRANGCPAAPKSSNRRSSTTMSRMFGRACAAALPADASRDTPSSTDSRTNDFASVMGSFRRPRREANARGFHRPIETRVPGAEHVSAEMVGRLIRRTVGLRQRRAGGEEPPPGVIETIEFDLVKLDATADGVALEHGPLLSRMPRWAHHSARVTGNRKGRGNARVI